MCLQKQNPTFPPLLLAPLPCRPSKAQTWGTRRLAVLHTAFREHPETSHLHLPKRLARCRTKAASGDTEEALGRLALPGGQTEAPQETSQGEPGLAWCLCPGNPGQAQQPLCSWAYSGATGRGPPRVLSRVPPTTTSSKPTWTFLCWAVRKWNLYVVNMCKRSPLTNI